MASSPQNYSHSHHRFPWRGRELEICLESSGSSISSADSDPHMLVELTLSLYGKLAVPSPGGRGFYDFSSYCMPPKYHMLLPVDNASSQHSSTLDDGSQESIAVKIFELLGPEISSLAHAEVEGHMAMKMSANAVCVFRHDLDEAKTIVDYNRMMANGVSEESLGTCSVCLDEIKKELVWPVTLACSHIFHLGCIAPWLERQNSCPLCRSRQPIFMEL